MYQSSQSQLMRTIGWTSTAVVELILKTSIRSFHNISLILCEIIRTMHHRLFFDYMYLSSIFSAISSKYLKYQYVRHITTQRYKIGVSANNNPHIYYARALLMLIQQSYATSNTANQISINHP